MDRRTFPFTDYGYSRSWGWLLGWGILFIIAGLAAISAQFTATMVSVIFLGSIILIGGVISLIDTIANWWGRWRGFSLHFLMSVLYIVIGLLIIRSPILASVSLTLLLGIFYLVVGIFRIVFSSSLRTTRWGWLFFSGLISAVLGVLILISWPASSLFVIGLFVGIDLLFWGWAYVMAAFAMRS